jgi:flagellar basal-body rod protein FlgB
VQIANDRSGHGGRIVLAKLPAGWRSGDGKITRLSSKRSKVVTASSGLGMFNPIAATTIGALEQTLSFTERRHELLAGNIANMSVPDYRSRDLDVSEFQASLADSIQKPNAQLNHGRSATPFSAMPLMPGFPIELQQEMASLFGSDSSQNDVSIERLNPTTSHTRDDRWSGPRAATEAIVYHDNSDVSLEQQVNKISKNKHLHNLAISTLRNQFELLRAAITERA